MPQTIDITNMPQGTWGGYFGGLPYGYGSASTAATPIVGGIQPGGGYIRPDQAIPAEARRVQQLESNPLTATDYFGLAGNVNQFMNEQAIGGYIANMPGYLSNVGKQAGVIGEQLSGNVPMDVVNQILTRAAERGIATGGSGGPGANAAYLRALGMTSAGLQNQGMQNLNQMISATPVAEVFNPASLFIPERWAQQELATYNQTSAPRRVGNATVTPQGWAPTYTQFNI